MPPSNPFLPCATDLECVSETSTPFHGEGFPLALPCAE